jgi:hypothetical protein
MLITETVAELHRVDDSAGRGGTGTMSRRRGAGRQHDGEAGDAHCIPEGSHMNFFRQYSADIGLTVAP